MRTEANDPLLERERELAAIARALADARAGEGSCVVVAGAAGLGKSRLLAASRELAAAEGMRVLRSRGDELEREFPFGVAVQLFGPAVAAGDGAGPPLHGAARLAAPLFEPADDAPEAEEESSLFHGLHWLAANLAERAPLLLVVDDLQWADGLSVRFLHYLAQRLDELPIAVVAAVRSEDGAPTSRPLARLWAHAVTVALDLAPLTPQATSALVASALGRAPDPPFARACAELTQGNPLFLRELLAAAGEDGLRPVADDVERLTSLGGRSLGGVVRRRLSELPEDAARLTAALAVLGDRCPLTDAAALAALDPERAADLADRLAGAGLLVSGDRLSFAHPVLREAVDGDLAAARRHRLHLRAAQMLRDRAGEAERAAEHVVRAGGAQDDWAVGVMRAGARHAMARRAPATAARYLRAAADGAGPEVLAELALAEARAGEEGAAARALEAIDAAAPGRDAAELALRLGLALLGAGQHRGAVAAFDRGLATTGDASDVARTLRAERAAAVGLGALGDTPPEVDELVERAVAGEATRSERAVLAHAALTAALQGTSAAEATRLARAALPADPDVPRTGEMVPLTLATAALLVADELEEVEHLTTAILERAREHGSLTAFATAAHVRAHARERSGSLAEAVADAQHAIEAGRYGWEPALPAAHAVLALALIERGELAAAEAALELPDAKRRFGDTLTWNDLLEARARLLLALGRPADALGPALECGRNLEALGMSHASVVPWRATAARAALGVGDVEQAARLAQRDVELSRAFGAPRALAWTLRTAAQIAGGDRAVVLLREAVDLLAPTPARLERAHALADLGAALLREGHRLAARDPLREALDLADGCGATPLAERAREALVAAGARPRRSRTSGRDALTPREQRLVEMAASGMTNRQIAEALFITKKTVESHLAHAFRKLGVSSREDLAPPSAAPAPPS